MPPARRSCRTPAHSASRATRWLARPLPATQPFGVTTTTSPFISITPTQNSSSSTRTGQPGFERWGAVARPAAVDDRHPRPVRRPGADRDRLAGRSRVRRDGALPACGLDPGAGRHRALPDRIRRQVPRLLVRGGDQPERLARPQGRRLARSRGAAAAGLRARRRAGRRCGRSGSSTRRRRCGRGRSRAAR